MRLRSTDAGHQARPIYRWLSIDGAAMAAIAALFFGVAWALLEAM